jgi:hypothetical protein
MLARTKWWRGLGVAVIASVALSACEDTVVNVPPTPEPPAAPITIAITPAQLDLLVGQTQQVVATVTGGAEGTSRAVTYSSSNAAVATVSATGVVTAVAPGAASIIATATADATVRAAAGVNVTAVAPPVVPPTPTTKVTIQSITEGVTLIPVNPDDVNGLINVNLNVERGTATQLRVLLNGQEIPGCTQNFGTSANEPAPLTAEGLTISAQTQIITCSLNTDRFDVNKDTWTATVAYPNNNYVIKAELRSPTGVIDAASTGTLKFNNADMMQAFVQSSGHAGFPNSIIGQDALQWHAGNITFNVVPVIYSDSLKQGTQFAGYPSQVTLAMTGTAGGNQVTTSRTQLNRTGGGFVVTFPGVQGGSFDDGNVNQFNSTSLGSPITASSITNQGQPGPNSPNRFRFIDLQSGTALPNSILRIDNEMPDAGALVLAPHPQVAGPQAVSIRNGWINGTYAFSSGKVGQNDSPHDIPGVGLTGTAGVVTYHASKTASVPTNWTAMDAIANANPAITTGAALEQSLTNSEYVVVARVVDRLGNRSYVRLSTKHSDGESLVESKTTGAADRIGVDFTIPRIERLRDVVQYNPGLDVERYVPDQDPGPGRGRVSELQRSGDCPYLPDPLPAGSGYHSFRHGEGHVILPSGRRGLRPDRELRPEPDHDAVLLAALRQGLGSRGQSGGESSRCNVRDVANLHQGHGGAERQQREHPDRHTVHAWRDVPVLGHGHG